MEFDLAAKSSWLSPLEQIVKDRGAPVEAASTAIGCRNTARQGGSSRHVVLRQVALPQVALLSQVASLVSAET